MSSNADIEKKGAAEDTKSETDIGPGEILSNDNGSKEASTVDGDDALKLAGAHAHQFDEAYYKRLRWKIVRCSRLHGRACR
jgi:hypothetical protein